ncbi:MAG: DUF6597 domain-containing transcriptional factor [Devosia sp.]|uniref:DUF6597 domain-containing transcriptional factor n=1 Tax=Devosia sp. TaxID=1871048 RepID=UPI0033967B6E
MARDDIGVFQKPAEPYDPRGRLDPAGFARHVRFTTKAPVEALQLFIEHFWVIRWDVAEGTYHSAEVMHRPYVDVFLASDRSGIQGTFRGKRVYPASGSGRIVGARFRPGAFHAFWGEELSNIQDQILPLDRVFSGLDRARTTTLLAGSDEEALAALSDLLVSCNPKPDENIVLVNAIIAAIEADAALTTVAAVAGAFERSERWVQQLFRDYLGIGLKWFLQRRRLLAAAELIRDSDAPDWVGIAYDLGYSSQQHFITIFARCWEKRRCNIGPA